ncbi:MAG TPA: rhomboid family intramembrane serine protease [Lacibacter sp.]|nr:rhomboid family intramembrane serine protease [Lacibacter sp.]HMO88517.1 rhomboid family intramembrane serine protease [Lacibacter sp.]HMP87806.1 rhomboid family intramembrane serine protease [Lacibacter sp.]
MSYLQAQRKTGKRFIDDGNPVLMLIFINVFVFILLNFIQITYVLSNAEPGRFEAEVLRWFELPDSLSALLTRPWTLLTHMFSQFSLWHMIGNMFFLWAFGYLLQDISGSRHVTPLYLYGALAGALLFLLSVNLVPRFATLAGTITYAGASAAVMAIAVAATVLAPDYRIFPMINGGIPLWIITVIYIIINFAGLASLAFPHHLAHLTGAAMGFGYIRGVQNGYDPGAWMHRSYAWFLALFAPRPAAEKPSLKKAVFYNTRGEAPYKKTMNVTQQRIDALLDKIGEEGYDALTAEEKEFLKRAGGSGS